MCISARFFVFTLFDRKPLKRARWNPSSGFLIGTFKDYAKHPILSFYNRNLTNDFDRLQDCPQLSVSVNTDDQGVFSTSLENEYSLLANALENAVDEDGHYIYNRTMIYSWIDDIRKMGINQSFLVDTAEYGKLLNEKGIVCNKHLWLEGLDLPAGILMSYHVVALKREDQWSIRNFLSSLVA